MEKLNELAIILRAVRFEDRHLMVTALAERSGVITAIAKNAVQSRRFGGTLEAFAASDWTYQRKPHADIAFLEEAQIRRAYTGIRASLEKLSMASAMNEFVLRALPPEQAAPEIFRLHSNALAVIEESEGEPPITLLSAYLGKLLQWNGTQPVLAQCSLCDRELASVGAEGLYFDVSDASWSCHEHEKRGSHARFLSTPQVVEFGRQLSVPIRACPESLVSIDEQKQLFTLVYELALYHFPGFDREGFKSLEILGLRSSRPLPRSTAQWRAAED